MSPLTGSPRQNLAQQIAAQASEIQEVALAMRKYANREVVSVDSGSPVLTTAAIFAGLLRVAQLSLGIALKLGKLEGSKNNVS